MEAERNRRRRGRGAALAALAVGLATAGSAIAFDPEREEDNFAKTSEREQYITKTPEFQTLLAEKEVESNLENVEIQTTDPERNPYGNVCWSRQRECAGDVRFYDWADGHGWNPQAGPVHGAQRRDALGQRLGDRGRARASARRRDHDRLGAGARDPLLGNRGDARQHGYVVLTYDVQGQGRSDTFGAGPDQQEGVPSQAGQPFFDGTEDALDFLLSTPTIAYVPRKSCGNANGGVGTSHADKQRRRVRDGFNAAFNPLHGLVDRRRIGIAGHSLGAAGVSYVGQLDRRVDAIVAWDNLGDASDEEGSRFGVPDCPSGSSRRARDGEADEAGARVLERLRDRAGAEHRRPRSRERRTRASSATRGPGSTRCRSTSAAAPTRSTRSSPARPRRSSVSPPIAAWTCRAGTRAAWLDRHVKCGGSKACQRRAEKRLLTDRWQSDAPGGASTRATTATSSPSTCARATPSTPSTGDGLAARTCARAAGG